MQRPHSDSKPAPRSPSRGEGDGPKSSASTPPALDVALPHAGSKQALVIEMLSAKGGATLAALVEATGWLPHTTRAVLTGLRKRGVPIERSREAAEASTYRIGSTPASVRA